MPTAPLTRPAPPARLAAPARTLPNFLIIGAQKSGTTTLAEALDQHPDVYISKPKEPHYLAYGDRLNVAPFPDSLSNSRPNAATLDEYTACFAAGDGAHARGEASPSSMPVARALDRAVSLLGTPKIVAILRQPAERAYSNYTHVVARHGETCRTFEHAIDAEPGRIGAGWGPVWHYVAKGFYHRQLKPWADAVGSENLKVVLFEDLKRDLGKLIGDLFEFLDVDPSFVADTGSPANVTRVPRNRIVGKFIRAVRPILSGPTLALPENWSRRLKAPFTSRPPKIAPETRARLTEGYREDILQLEEMIDRDLSGWLA